MNSEPVPIIHLLLTLRGPVWRVRILIPGEPCPRWRAYSATDYLEPEAVARRWAEGLLRRNEQQDDNGCYTKTEQDITHSGSPLRVKWEYWVRL